MSIYACAPRMGRWRRELRITKKKTRFNRVANTMIPDGKIGRKGENMMLFSANQVVTPFQTVWAVAARQSDTDDKPY